MSKKILIADQSETVRGVAESLFRSRGFEVVSASDGVESLELARKAGVDLAFLNSGLPEIDGYAVSRQIKSGDKTKNIKVVLFLSTSEIVDQHKLLSSLADDTLNKPFSPQDLLEAVSQALSIEIDGLEESNGSRDASEAIGDDVEEIDLDRKVDEEIDFGSIFKEGRTSSEESGLDGVFLSDETGADFDSEIADNAKRGDDDPVAVERVDESRELGDESEDVVRMAEDQYDLEAQQVRPEVEPPHDYNWFIREMKKDLTRPKAKSPGASAGVPSSTAGGAVRKAAAPGKPPQNQTRSDSFATEEIGTSKLAVAVESYHSEESERPLISSSGSADPEAETDRLSLAEKLLVKELASRLADNIVSRLSTTELKAIVREALLSLKKM